MAETGFEWWIERVRRLLSRVDVLRLDHFRAFESYWEVPAGEETAARGSWRPGPGEALFEALAPALGLPGGGLAGLPLVAEDLGVITPAVERLLQGLGLAGMKVLQFAFDEPGSTHLPHGYTSRCVAYTGTHDNDTSAAWFAGASEATRGRALLYLGGDGSAIHRDLVRAAWTSVAELAIAPLQDVLGLGAEARMNHPGQAAGNWTWRIAADRLTDEPATWLRALTSAAGRLAHAPAP
jgi:4-alpha-glucanotransferase